MKLLRELLNEAQEKNLIGLTINGKFITSETKNKKWTGNFNCFNNKLTSLTGAPASVGGDFYCSSNQLTSLTGAPTSVTGYFYCFGNQLTSLTGAPTTVTGGFNCYNNQLTSLTGAPTTVGGHFDCSSNQLTSLKDIHKQIKSIGETLYLSGNPIKTHVLGLLKIKRLKSVELDNKEVEKILNKYLPEGDLLDCQEELIEAGLDEFAQL
jgi:Leucine-rich repeat (LRR) protein